MAIYHCSAKIIGRSSGRSSVGAAAYRAGVKLHNEYDGLTHDFTRKKGIAHSEILLPPNAPAAYADRQTLWNAVEQIEKGPKAQLTREVEVALPVELDREEQIDLVRGYVQRAFVDRGMVADFSIHDLGSGNPHAHIMLTVRALDEQGAWLPKKRKEYILDANGNKQYDPKKKTYKFKTITTTDWNEQSNMEVWREQWATTCNQAFERKGLAERVDHRSYARQGIEQEPTVHLGYVASSMEKRGRQSERGNINREILASNAELAADLDLLQRELESITAQLQEPPAQDIAGRMVALYDRYVRLAMDMAFNRESRQSLAGGYQDAQREKEQLEEQAKSVQQYSAQEKRLQGKMDKLGLFDRKEKKETAAQLERAGQNKANALQELKRSFGVGPGGVKNKLAQLDSEMAATKEKHDSLPPLADLQREQGEVLEQYRQAYETAQAHPDAAAILESVATHKPPRVKSITGGLAGARAENELKRHFPISRPELEHQHRRERGGWEMEM